MVVIVIEMLQISSRIEHHLNCTNRSFDKTSRKSSEKQRLVTGDRSIGRWQPEVLYVYQSDAGRIEQATGLQRPPRHEHEGRVGRRRPSQNEHEARHKKANPAVKCSKLLIISHRIGENCMQKSYSCSDLFFSS